MICQVTFILTFEKQGVIIHVCFERGQSLRHRADGSVGTEDNHNVIRPVVKGKFGYRV